MVGLNKISTGNSLSLDRMLQTFVSVVRPDVHLVLQKPLSRWLCGDLTLETAPAVAETPEIKLFGKWSTDDVQINDISLQDYIAVKEKYAKYLPHSTVEHLTISMMFMTVCIVKHAFENMTLLKLFLALYLILFSGHVLANAHKCSQEKAVTCDSSGNTSLDTHAWYERYKDECRWTIKDKDGTVIRELTPSPNTNVQCTLPEIHLSINCIIPKRIDNCICYKLQTTEALYSYGAGEYNFFFTFICHSDVSHSKLWNIDNLFSFRNLTNDFFTYNTEYLIV
ncbi:uncharacterized protein LOC125145712 [Tachysurus fulvidraco]|uniref:uncharacterized protein LOC125145712 n=1 Tax=Tachysurus fulvidraco TaxID=1234273 RepID=UPI001FED8EC3|nr:uncharacterized protein LOC125145712 [Tachysurus fulvidraco]